MSGEEVKSLEMERRKRVLSGQRPTGRLHLGNLEGALRNWVKLQDEYDCFFFVADWHALTTDYEHTDRLGQNILEMLCDWLAAGLDPKKCTIFQQSRMPEHAELHLLFSMLVTVPRLERNPTVKEMVRDLGLEDRVSYGLLGYPVLQAADILIYRADYVPVGKDQLPHLELCREIARRFNRLYEPIFPEPEPLLTEHPYIPGIDGRKMSKSYGNAIFLSDPPDEIRSKVRRMFTDPRKVRMGDPGHPDECPVFALHSVYNPGGLGEIRATCESGERGCVRCKEELADVLVEALRPIRERREEFAKNPGEIWRILREGSERAREVAAETMRMVRKAMRMDWD